MTRSRLLLALLLSFAVFAAACGSDDPATETSNDSSDSTSDDQASDDPVATGGPQVGVVFDIGGRGDQSFNDAAAQGIDRAVETVGASFTESAPNADGSNRAELLGLQAGNSDIVLGVGFLFAESMATVATNNPDTNFAIVDDSSIDLPNVADLVFAEEQGSFLVGAAAALTSNNAHIGFVGGVNFPLIQKFQAGYEAGARSINPDIEIDVQYITEPPDFDGFADPASAKIIAGSMFERGADVVFHAAGGSGAGVFEAAADSGDPGEVWAIGVDSDQYNNADPAVQPYILTSMLKRVDVAVQLIVEEQANGTFAGGVRLFDLSVDGVGYSTTGDFLSAETITEVEALKAQIVSGEITVPTAP